MNFAHYDWRIGHNSMGKNGVCSTRLEANWLKGKDPNFGFASRNFFINGSILYGIAT